jgi:hypothetical protein
MLLTDSKWSTLAGGYRLPYDPRPAISKLAVNLDVANAWEELWDNLHHQGDVGEASYAAVSAFVLYWTRRTKKTPAKMSRLSLSF